jgi:hypothetical protein
LTVLTPTALPQDLAPPLRYHLDCPSTVFALTVVTLSRGFVAMTEFWIRMAIILVFGGGLLACSVAYLRAERDRNDRKSIIFLFAFFVIIIAAFVTADHFGLLDDYLTALG